MSKEHPGNFVTQPRAAEIAGVSVRTIGRLISEGRLKAVKPRGQWRVSMASLRKLMAGQPAEPELEYDPLLR